MNKILLFFSLCLGVISLKGQYTCERHQVSSVGGAQSNSLYSVTTTNHAYQAQIFQSNNYAGNTGFLYPNLHTLPPYINSITDVPNDQGKQVQIVWEKSDYDNSYSPNKFYSVWRQDDTEEEQLSNVWLNPLEAVLNLDKGEDLPYWNKDGEIWTYIDTIPALLYNQYSLVAPTLFDSVADNPAYSTFKIVFHDLYSFYESEPDSGYSIDNLAPEAPVLTSVFMEPNVELTWTENLEEDFQYYAIYRSNISGSFPSEPYLTTINTSFIDNDLIFDTIWYVVSSFDYNGNESEFSNIESHIAHTDLKLDITVFLEGPFNGTEMNTDLKLLNILPLNQPYNQSPWNYPGDESVASIPSDVVDWVLIEIRDASDAASATSYTSEGQQAAFLLANGSVVGLDGSSNLSFEQLIINSLFVVVWHRNHLPIMSNISLNKVGNTYSYNFSSAANQAYGNNQNDIGYGVFGMIGGDVNADGMINTNDKLLWQANAGTKGYLSTDLNLNGQVENKDKNDKWVKNNGISQSIPE